MREKTRIIEASEFDHILFLYLWVSKVLFWMGLGGGYASKLFVVVLRLGSPWCDPKLSSSSTGLSPCLRSLLCNGPWFYLYFARTLDVLFEYLWIWYWADAGGIYLYEFALACRFYLFFPLFSPMMNFASVWLSCLPFDFSTFFFFWMIASQVVLVNGEPTIETMPFFADFVALSSLQGNPRRFRVNILTISKRRTVAEALGRVCCESLFRFFFFLCWIMHSYTSKRYWRVRRINLSILADVRWSWWSSFE